MGTGLHTSYCLLSAQDTRPDKLSQQKSESAETRKPLIGIASLAGETYLHAIRSSGGIPVVLPCTDSNEIRINGYLEQLDGLLMPGGPDIPPSEYGEQPHPTVNLLGDDRYRFEKSLLDAWVNRSDKPLLGICLGSQWINVSHGGSLHQDIPSAFNVNHRGVTHMVRLEPDSRLANIFGETRFEVNSFHHQAVARLGNGLRIVAKSPDGIVEATESTDPNRFLLGVQWHPEKMPESDLQRKLFTAFIDACVTNAEKQPSSNPLIHVETGELPIILSAPHGGRNSIPDVPERLGVGSKKFVNVADSNTDRLTEKLADELQRQLGKRPYVVIARFHRKYLDVNRRAQWAYESDNARLAYDAYHQAISDARREIIERWGHGLLLDIHGQAADPVAIFRGTQNGKTTRNLTSRFGEQALIGETSLFGQLAKTGLTIVPEVDSTEREHDAFDGGYIVVTHGSQEEGSVDAIQLELGGRLRTKSMLEPTAEKLATAITAFATDYLPKSPLSEKVTEAVD
ncbi:gamma-glutamyl-gamma-aminobutyrate hydrolase family protein [Stieleria varia]|nr:gamma-glutamyl-gamma-aminobutyrate hydrolase family protein [Stieleria varia]